MFKVLCPFCTDTYFSKTDYLMDNQVNVSMRFYLVLYHKD